MLAPFLPAFADAVHAAFAPGSPLGASPWAPVATSLAAALYAAARTWLKAQAPAPPAPAPEVGALLEDAPAPTVPSPSRSRSRRRREVD